MTKIFIILFVSLMFEAVGVVLLSKGLKELPNLEAVSVGAVTRHVVAGVKNRNVVLGVALEALFFFGFLMLMSEGDVSFVWPLTSLNFVIATLAAKWLLHEQVDAVRWGGVCLIVLGVGLITWSEKSKRDGSPATSVRVPESGTVTK
jgi:uncharacterized membrane protein